MPQPSLNTDGRDPAELLEPDELKMLATLSDQLTGIVAQMRGATTVGDVLRIDAIFDAWNAEDAV